MYNIAYSMRLTVEQVFQRVVSQHERCLDSCINHCRKRLCAMPTYKAFIMNKSSDLVLILGGSAFGALFALMLFIGLCI